MVIEWVISSMRCSIAMRPGCRTTLSVRAEKKMDILLHRFAASGMKTSTVLQLWPCRVPFSPGGAVAWPENGTWDLHEIFRGRPRACAIEELGNGN
jgi:hypothetical protein